MRLEIGDRNQFREFCTVHRGTTKGGGVTRVGSDSLFMAYTHIAHDCQVGNRIVFANNATLAGHVEVHDDANISAFSSVHQFCRVGRHAYVGGYTVATLDALPFVKTVGQKAACYGLNSIGLRRKGISEETLRRLEAAYRILVRSRLPTSKALEQIRAELAGDPGRRLPGGVRRRPLAARGCTSRRRAAAPAGEAILSNSSPRPLRVGVFGTGSMGRNHVRLLSSLPGAELVGIYDLRPECGFETAAREHGARVFSRLEELAGEIEAAVVAAPTVAHAEMGCALLDRGLHLLIEKPLAASLEEADRLLAHAGKQVLAVGHIEFFNPAVQALLGVGSPPRFVEVQRLGVFSPRSLDVDVVLDLMIHDLQILHALDPSPVAEIRATGIAVLSARIDIANVRVELESGAVANLTASRVSSERARKLRLFLPNRYYSLDGAARDRSRGGRLGGGGVGAPHPPRRPRRRAGRAAQAGARGVPRRLPGGARAASRRRPGPPRPRHGTSGGGGDPVTAGAC